MIRAGADGRAKVTALEFGSFTYVPGQIYHASLKTGVNNAYTLPEMVSRLLTLCVKMLDIDEPILKIAN